MSLSANGMLHLILKCRFIRHWYRNPLEKVSRVRHDESTSNLVHHAENCDPKSSGATRMLAAYTRSYNPGKLHVNIAIWAAHCHWPFNIFEDPEFIEILMSLNNKVSIPSWFTVSHDIQTIFETTKANVIAMLQVCSASSIPTQAHALQIGQPWQATPLY